MSKERTCIFCGKTYQYCPNCRDFSSYPTWMANFDTEKCHDLYNVIAGYNIGVRKIEDVKSALDKYGVKDYSIFPKSFQEKLTDSVFEKKEEITEEIKEDIKEDVKEESKEDNKETSNQNKEGFAKGNNNYYPRKMKKNNYGRRDGE